MTSKGWCPKCNLHAPQGSTQLLFRCSFISTGMTKTVICKARAAEDDTDDEYSPRHTAQLKRNMIQHDDNPDILAVLRSQSQPLQIQTCGLLKCVITSHKVKAHAHVPVYM